MLKIKIIKPKKSKLKIALPNYLSTVKAGFPSPAEDFVENKLDLNEFLIKHPAATYFVRVSGNSMKDAGISDGDLLVVDCALEPNEKSIVIACVNQEYTVKRIKRINGELYLVAENADYKPIKIDPSDEFQVFGVVTTVIKNCMK